LGLLPFAGGRDRYNHSRTAHGRPPPSLGDWPPLAVQLGHQAEMSTLTRHLEVGFEPRGASNGWMGTLSIAVAVHNSISEWIVWNGLALPERRPKQRASLWKDVSSSRMGSPS
jgi:hypothetical protein